MPMTRRSTPHHLLLILTLCLGCHTFEEVDPYAASDAGGGDASGQGPTFVAVGSGTRIDVTDDGVTWEAADVDTVDPSLRLNGVAWGDGRWVAVAFDTDDDSGAVAISDDGRAWSVLDDGTLPQLRSVVHVDGWFYTASSPLLRSDDGETWVVGASLPGQPEVIAAGGGQLVTVGSSHSGGALVAWSSDGVAWSERDLGGPALLSVVYGRGLFVAVGREGRTIASSDGGATWQEGDRLGDGLNLEVGFDGERFFTTQAGPNTIFTSEDGLTWTTDGVLGYEHIGHRDGRYVGADGDGRRAWADDLNGFVVGERVEGAAYWYVGARP